MKKATPISTTKPLELTNNSLNIYQDGGAYINLLRMYHVYYNKIQNVIEVVNVDLTAMRTWIGIVIKQNIVKKHFLQHYESETKKELYSDYFYFTADKYQQLCKDGSLNNTIASLQRIVFHTHS